MLRAPAVWSEYLRNAASNISCMAQLSSVWMKPCWTSSSDRTCGVSEFREIMQFSCLFMLSSKLRSILRLMCPSFFSVSSKSHCIERILLFHLVLVLTLRGRRPHLVIRRLDRREGCQGV